MKRRNLKRVVLDNLSSYAFLVPWLIGFFVLTLYPMVYSLYLSFTKFNILQPPHWVGLKNYIVMFTGNAVSIDRRALVRRHCPVLTAADPAWGWDGVEGTAPGFPDDGSWVVESEGFSKMPV